MTVQLAACSSRFGAASSACITSRQMLVAAFAPPDIAQSFTLAALSSVFEST